MYAGLHPQCAARYFGKVNTCLKDEFNPPVLFEASASVCLTEFRDRKDPL